MHRIPEANTNKLSYEDRMPRTRLALYACFVLLALLALLRFDLVLLVPITLVPFVQFKDSTRMTVFGKRRPRAPASEPRDTGDPLVRVYLVIGGILLIAGLVMFLWRPIAAAPGPLMSILPNWVTIPGVHAILLGAVLTALGIDLLRGGLARRSDEPQDLEYQDTIASEGPGILRYAVPWLALAGVAYLADWPALVQAAVALVGLGLVRHVAKSLPLFAALSAPAVAFYGWSAAGHAKNTAGPTDMIEFVIFVVATIAGVGLVAYTLGRAVTGVLNTIKRRTWAREPWLKQVVQGSMGCVLAFSAHTHVTERAALREAAEVTAREAALAAAERSAAAKRAEAQAIARAEAAALRAEARARIPGVSCSFSRANGLEFEYQHENPVPGPPWKVERYIIGGTDDFQTAPRAAIELGASVDLPALRQHAGNAPILRLSSGDVVFMSPTGARLLMLNPDGRVLQLGSFHEPLLRNPTMTCVNADGMRWAVALGPVVKVFRRFAPEALPHEVHQESLDYAWFP